MSFACPVRDQRLVLEHVVRMPELARSNRFAEATPDMVDAVLQAAHNQESAQSASTAILALAPAETAEDDVTVVVVRRLPQEVAA